MSSFWGPLQVVEQLIEQLNSEVVGMTILIQGARISLSVIGQPEPEILIQTLEVVKTDLIKSQVKQEMEQEQFPMDEMIPVEEEPEKVA